MSEIDEFLKDVKDDQATPETDVLDQPIVPDGEKPEGEVKSKDDEEDDEEGVKPRNRRERRLLRKLDGERESNIFLAGKLAAREEAERTLTEESDYLKGVERIYGTETPEAQLATDLLKKAIVGARDDAETRAYERIKSERQKELEEEREATKALDNILDEIEDTYDVTLTEAQERSYFQLLQKMSSKDSEGNVISLADPHAVWEVFQEKLKSRTPVNRAKDLSNRSLTQSGASKDTTLQDDVVLRTLQDNGII